MHKNTLKCTPRKVLKIRFIGGRTRVTNSTQLPCESPRHEIIIKQKETPKKPTEGRTRVSILLLPCESPRHEIKTIPEITKPVHRGENES